MTDADWIARIGELYGSPFQKFDGGWGITVYPTEQQEDVIRERHRACCDEEPYSVDYLKGAIAVSIDKNGTERKLAITDGQRWQMQSDWNGHWTQKCDARPRTRADDENARWEPPEATPAARRKGQEAMQAAIEAEKPDEPDEALDKFMASMRRNRAARIAAGADDGETGSTTKNASEATNAARDADEPASPRATGGTRPETAAPPEKLDIAASVTDLDAWKAWSDAVGELRGKPRKLDDGWGIEITLTAQQAELVEARQRAVNDNPDADIDRILAFDHLRGMDAVSVDRSGRERPVRITDSNTYGSRYDYDGNTVWTCKTEPRQPERYEPTKPVVRGAERPVGAGAGDTGARERTAPRTGHARS